MLKIVENEAVREEGYTLDALAREGARRMLMSALEEEVAAYVERHAEARDGEGRRLVVRNGQARARGITCGAGTLEVRAPRVNDRRVDEEGERCRFTSRILPPYMRRSPKVAEVLPVLYLRGLSTGDFRPALETLLGEEAAGLSATNIARLTGVWEEEYRAFRKRSLKESDYLYVWADGVHFNVRAGGGAAVYAGAHRGACGRAEGVDRGRRRLPRECGELEDGAAGSKTARYAGAGLGGR